MSTLTAFLWHNQAVRCISVAGATLLVYDYLLTFPDEVNLVWRSRWSIGKVLFLATRYLCFADTALVLIYLFDPQLDTKTCKSVYNTSAYLIVAGIFIAEIIMSMRTYALWGRSKRLFYPMVIVLISGITAIIVVYVKKATNLIWIDSPVPHLVTCVSLNQDNIKVFVAFGLLMGYESIILVLTVWIGIKQWRADLYESPLFKRFYRDGALYFSIMFAASAANFAIRLRRVANGDYYDLLIVAQTVLHSVLSARIILNLRQPIGDLVSDSSDNADITTVQFASRNGQLPSSGQVDTTVEGLEMRGLGKG